MSARNKVTYVSIYSPVGSAVEVSKGIRHTYVAQAIVLFCS
jgi:hypothetical protein